MNLEDLPIELLSIILSHIRLRKDCHRVCQVSSKLCDVMRSVSRRRFKLRLLESASNTETKLMFFVKAKVLPFTRIEGCKYQTSAMPKLRPFFEKFGDEITEIGIKYSVKDVGQLLVDLTTFMHKLKEIKLIQDDTESGKRKKEEDESIYIPTRKIEFPLVEILDLTQTHASIDMVEFLASCCPILKQIKLADHYQLRKEKKFYDLLLKWTSEGKVINYYMTRSQFVNLMDVPMENFNLQELNINPNMINLGDFFASPRRIGKMNLLDRHFFRRDYTKASLEMILKSNSSIDCLAFLSSNFPDFDIFQVLDQSTRLKSLEVTLNSSIFPPSITPKVDQMIQSVVIGAHLTTPQLVRILEQLHFLEKVEFNSTIIASNEVLQTIFQTSGAHLKEFHFDRVTRKNKIDFTDDIIESLSNLPKLEKITLISPRSGLSGRVLEVIRSPKLKELKLSLRTISVENLEILLKNCPMIKHFQLDCRTCDRIKYSDIFTYIYEHFLHVEKFNINFVRMDGPSLFADSESE